MGLFKKKSAGTATVQQIVDFLGLGDVPADRLSEATYFACLKILSESVGKLPLKLLQKTEKGGVRKAYEHSLYRVLAYRPNPYMTATHLWSTTEYNRNHCGNAYVWILGAGSKTELYVLPSDDVQVWVDNKGIFGQKNAIWYVYTCVQNGKLYKIPYDSILEWAESLYQSYLS